MEQIPDQMKPRLATWIGLALMGAFSVASVFSFLAYMSNGIAAGAIIGLPGREMDVMIVQHRAAVWLVVCAVFQFGSVVALFSILRFGAEADRFVRYASRGVVATFLSFVKTLVVGGIIFEMVNLLRPHLR
jgi:hypothetical protein